MPISFNPPPLPTPDRTAGAAFDNGADAQAADTDPFSALLDAAADKVVSDAALAKPAVGEQAGARLAGDLTVDSNARTPGDAAREGASRDAEAGDATVAQGLFAALQALLPGAMPMPAPEVPHADAAGVPATAARFAEGSAQPSTALVTSASPLALEQPADARDMPQATQPIAPTPAHVPSPSAFAALGAQAAAVTTAARAVVDANAPILQSPSPLVTLAPTMPGVALTTPGARSAQTAASAPVAASTSPAAALAALLSRSSAEPSTVFTMAAPGDGMEPRGSPASAPAAPGEVTPRAGDAAAAPPQPDRAAPPPAAAARSIEAITTTIADAQPGEARPATTRKLAETAAQPLASFTMPPAPRVVTIATPALTPAWREDVVREVAQVVVLRQGEAELRVTPQELGPISVHVSIERGEATLVVTAAHAATRDALEQALPALRESLAQQGITLGQASVQDDRPRAFDPPRTPAQEPGATSSGTTAPASAPPSAITRPRGLIDTFA